MVRYNYFNSYLYKTWKCRIQNQAYRMAKGDPDFADDLMQEGLVKLLEFDRNGMNKHAPGYIWRVLRNHMINVYHREQRARIIGGQESPNSWSGRRRSAPKHIAARRVRRQFKEGPQQERAIPDTDEDDIELWNL